jgi:hypothetical protein
MRLWRTPQIGDMVMVIRIDVKGSELAEKEEPCFSIQNILPLALSRI